MLDILVQFEGKRVVRARVSRGGCVAQFNLVRRGEDFRGVQRDLNLAIIGQNKAERELDRHQVPLRGQMIGKSALLAVVAQPAAFECEKNVTALPAPVQTVDVRVQRMIGRILGWITMIQIRRQTDVKTES